MSFSGHTTRPRNALVIVGGFIALIGLVGGALVTTPDYHRAMTMKEEPTEMTWQELVDNGLTDNSYVRLVDVDLNRANPLGALEDLFKNFDPEAPVEDRQELAAEFAEEVNIGKIAESAMQPIKVFPKGKDPADVPVRVVVPQTPQATQAAFAEIEENGTLTGRFMLRESNRAAIQMQHLVSSQVKAAEAQARANAGLEIAQNDDEEGKIVGNDGPRWEFEPVSGTLSEADARQWFWLSGFAAAIGLVICGAGGPSLACCVFFQGPAILSLLGLPMRYGRAGKITRLVYLGIGMGLIVYGYQKMVVEGQFGETDGDIGLAVLGYLAGAVGAGAIMGALTSVVAQRLNIDLEPKSTMQTPEPKMSYTEACSLEPPEADQMSRYVDRDLVSSYGLEMPEAMQPIADMFTSVGFGEPEPVVWVEGEQQCAALIQLGCQEMVVADVDEIDGEVHVRLVSVLHDGIAIVSLSHNMPAQKPLRFGGSGLYCVSQSDDPIEMLSAHLEQTISMAEKRRTSVVRIEPIEATDVILFGRRVLADVRAQYGEENTEVGECRYGRFSFPPAPVAEPATMDESL